MKIKYAILGEAGVELMNEPVYITEEEEKGHQKKLSKLELSVKIKQLINRMSSGEILQRHCKVTLRSLEQINTKRDSFFTLLYELNDITEGKVTDDTQAREMG